MGMKNIYSYFIFFVLTTFGYVFIYKKANDSNVNPQIKQSTRSLKSLLLHKYEENIFDFSTTIKYREQINTEVFSAEKRFQEFISKNKKLRNPILTRLSNEKEIKKLEYTESYKETQKENTKNENTEIETKDFKLISQENTVEKEVRVLENKTETYTTAGQHNDTDINKIEDFTLFMLHESTTEKDNMKEQVPTYATQEIVAITNYKNNTEATKTNLTEKQISDLNLLYLNTINNMSIIDTLKNEPKQLTVYDYPHPIITKCDHLCPKNINLTLVFLIKSFIKNFDARMAIRETWGLDDPYPEVKTRHVFLMGVDYNNDSVRLETLRENEKFGDIILADYQDEYDNNSIKDVMGFNWAKTFCPNSKFYILADDDAYISVKNLVNYLKFRKVMNPFSLMYKIEDDETEFDSKFFGGFVHETIPQRDGKWKVTYEEYPYEKYPKFLNGHFIVMSRPVLDVLCETAKYTKFFKLDDVYLGFVAYRAGLECQSIPRVTNMKINIDVVHAFDDLISSHYITPTELTFIFTVQRQKGNA